MRCLLLFLLLANGLFVRSQDIQGKWIGKITQLPGGYSELYDLEMDLSQRRTLWGESYAYEGDSVRVRIGLSGRIEQDSIVLSESEGWIREDVVPWSWIACVKSYFLAYKKEGEYEYLVGRWSGYSKEDRSDRCQPGKVILARSQEALDNYLQQRQDSVVVTESIATLTAAPELIDFKSSFLGTEPKKVSEIIVNNTNLQIQLLDYMKVDNDTISVYLNRKILSKNIFIGKRPAILNFKIDPRIEVHELLLYAENLGLIPPNTSEMVLVDGDKRHRVMIVSDKQKTAAVYLRYKPQRGT